MSNRKSLLYIIIKTSFHILTNVIRFMYLSKCKQVPYLKCGLNTFYKVKSLQTSKTLTPIL